MVNLNFIENELLTTALASMITLAIVGEFVPNLKTNLQGFIIIIGCTALIITHIADTVIKRKK